MTKNEEIKDQLRDSFGAAAGDYVRSTGHAQGGDLGRMVELAGLRGDERVLDIATGGGHTALAFAEHVHEVVACDLTPRMLEAAREYIIGRSVTNVSFELADAENLPFDGASFDVVTSRIAPHHFPEPKDFVSEVARVLRPGGLFLLDDNMAPEDPELDAFMNRFEKWRDPGHVRAYTIREWRNWLEETELRIEHVDPLVKKRYPFDEWTARMRMPEGERAALEDWLISASQGCKEFFEISVGEGRVLSLSGVYAIIVARLP